MRNILLLLSIILFFSCEKFEHSELNVPNCNLCDYASSVEGTYRGYRNSIYPQQEDSLTILVQQIYLGNSQIEDSTIIFLEMTTIYDNLISFPIIDTIRIDNSQGYNMDYVKGGGDPFYYVKQDSIELQHFINEYLDICGNCGILYRQ